MLNWVIEPDENDVLTFYPKTDSNVTLGEFMDRCAASDEMRDAKDRVILDAFSESAPSLHLAPVSGLLSPVVKIGYLGARG